MASALGAKLQGSGAEPPVGPGVKPLVMGEADDIFALEGMNDTLNNKNCTIIYAINATIGT